MKNQGKIPRRHSPPAFGLIPVKTIQKPGQVLVLTDIEPIITNHIRNGSPIAIYGTRLEVSLFEKVQEEVS